MTKIQEIADHYIIQSLRDAVAEINQFLPAGTQYSHQALQTWLTGSRKPDRFRMLWLSQYGEGWVRDFATEILAVLKEGKNDRPAN